MTNATPAAVQKEKQMPIAGEGGQEEAPKND